MMLRKIKLRYFIIEIKSKNDNILLWKENKTLKKYFPNEKMNAAHECIWKEVEKKE